MDNYTIHLAKILLIILPFIIRQYNTNNKIKTKSINNKLFIWNLEEMLVDIKALNKHSKNSRPNILNGNVFLFYNKELNINSAERNYTVLWF